MVIGIVAVVGFLAVLLFGLATGRIDWRQQGRCPADPAEDVADLTDHVGDRQLDAPPSELRGARDEHVRRPRHGGGLCPGTQHPHMLSRGDFSISGSFAPENCKPRHRHHPRAAAPERGDR